MNDWIRSQASDYTLHTLYIQYIHTYLGAAVGGRGDKGAHATRGVLCGRVRMEEMACSKQEIMCIRRAECDRQRGWMKQRLRPIVWLPSPSSPHEGAGR